jgi:hypothetical protein
MVPERRCAARDHHALRIGDCDGDERKLSAKLRAMAAERGVEVCIAHDGMKLSV